MTNKKILLSVTASAAIASAFIATDSADAASYKVKAATIYGRLHKIKEQPFPN